MFIGSRVALVGLAAISLLALPAAAAGEAGDRGVAAHSGGLRVPGGSPPGAPHTLAVAPSGSPITVLGNALSPPSPPVHSTAQAAQPAYGTSHAGPGGPQAPPSTVSCSNDPARDTARLLAALASALPNGRITIAAGTCALTAKLAIREPLTISGAGPNATFLVQRTARTGIFLVNAQHVSVENLNLNTAAANPTSYGSHGGTYAPGVLFSAQSYTSIVNVSAEVGDGFGMRLTGTNPCAAYPTTGTVISNVAVTNVGSGGRAAIDVDCTNGARISNITIHGQYLALYQDENVSVSGEAYSPASFMGPCHAPWYVSGPAANISITGVSGGGRGISTGSVRNVVAADRLLTARC